MLNVSRRGLLGMLAVGVGAAIVRPGLIMPIKPVLVPKPLVGIDPGSGGTAMFIDGRGIKFNVDTNTPSLIEAMDAAMRQSWAPGTFETAQFLVDPHASYRLDKEFEARGLTPWVMNDADRFLKARSVHTIQRMFRGVPVEHFPTITLGLEHLLSPPDRQWLKLRA